MDSDSFTHVSLTVDGDGVATVLLDRADASMNTLGPELQADLDRVLDRLEQDDAIQAIVLASGKPDSFVAGADVYFLATLETGEQAVEALEAAHRAFLRFELLWRHRRKPVVAAIHGPALGGGLELALACSARVASDDPRTRLGQPEVQLGLIPGAGGTQRLPRLVGLELGLDLVTSGRPLRPSKALAAGLVDEVVPKDRLLAAATRRALDAVGGAADRRRRRTPDVASLRRRALESPLGRRLVFRQAEKQILARTKGNYPAPMAALRAVRTGFEHGIQAGYHAELAEFATLIESPEAAALMSIFFATQDLKDDPGIDSDADPRPVEKVGVIGGGLMGGGIATVSVTEAGRETRIKEVDDDAVARGVGYVEKVLDTRRGRGRLDEAERSRLMGMLSGSSTWEGFEDTDLFVEAVFEDLDLKRSILSQVEAIAPDAIFASNTSSLPIGAIAEGAARPEQVVGMHYFSPVERMPLLEVIVTDRTDDRVTATCVAEGKRQGKHVIVVRDGTGFYTSRILAPYMIEVGLLLEEGVPIPDIDRAMVKWGFPVGPVTLTDEVGIDVGAKIGVIMHEAFGDRMAPPAAFRRLVEDDRKGRKNGRGFYRYEDGEKKGVDEGVYEVLGISPTESIPAEDIQERLALHMVNEAARCLEEGILRSARDGDVGAVFGLGFPPFRGGPFFWVDQVGAGTIVERLDRLAEAHGSRYEPAAILRERASSGERFRSGTG